MKEVGYYTLDNKEEYYSQESIGRLEYDNEKYRKTVNYERSKAINKLVHENERIHKTLVRIKNNLTLEEKEEHKETIQNLMYRKEENYNEITKLTKGVK